MLNVNIFLWYTLPLPLGNTTVNLVDKIKQVQTQVNQHSRESESLKGIDTRTQDAVKKWVKNEPSNFVHALWCKLPGCKLEAFSSAESKFDFDKVPQDVCKLANKKANLIKVIAIITLVAGAVLMSVGVLLPLVMIPALIALPEVVAIAVVASCTLGAAFGVAAYTSGSICLYSKTIRWACAINDKEFRYFADEIVQKEHNLTEEQLKDRKLHKIYNGWKGEVEVALKEV